MKVKVKTPGIGFFAVCLSFVCALIGFIMYFQTYGVGGFPISRWPVALTVISLWLLLLLAANGLFFGNKPAWTGVIYALTAFMLVYAFLILLKPCITAIGFVVGAGDLNMGDVERNKAIFSNAITTAVFYVLAALFLVIGAFCSLERKNKKEGGNLQ